MNLPIFDFAIRTHFESQQSQFLLQATCHTAAKHIAIIGASGSGKSLTLNILAGLYRPQTAKIIIQQNIYADPEQGVWIAPNQRKIGLVFQNYALFPHLTVAQNIAFGLYQTYRNPPRQIDPLTLSWLNNMQLRTVAHHYPHQISGGQKQRTALARACIAQPKCLLLDEPFSALDPNLRIHTRQIINDIRNDLDIPMILVSHDHHDVEILCQEIWQMDAGRLSQYN